MGRPNTTGLNWQDPGYQTKWGRQNPERARAYRQKYYPRLQRKYQRRLYWLNKYVAARGCDQCGYNAHPTALDWDHLDRSSKSFCVGTRIPGASLKRLFAEIRKCVLLCANCHRIKTYEENRVSRQ